MGYDIKELVYSRNVVEFATVAKEYCAFFDNIERYSRIEFVGIAGKLVPLLYYKATLLPLNEPLYEEGSQKYVTEDIYEDIRLKIKVLLKQHDDFPEIFDPRVSETDEQFTATISEYLADVYQDLKNFTMLYQKGQVEEMNDALWECNTNFREFWGIRLANGLRALHLLNFSGLDLETDDEDSTTESDKDTSNWFVTRRQNDNI
jgi:hypothetical protein